MVGRFKAAMVLLAVVMSACSVTSGASADMQDQIKACKLIKDAAKRDDCIATVVKAHTSDRKTRVEAK